MKKLAQENSRSLSTSIFNEILELKNSMNNLRTDYEGYIISSEMINKHWLVGFIEGDGTFYFSNSSVVFGITQKDNKILEAIQTLLRNIPLLPPSLISLMLLLKTIQILFN